MHVCIVLNIGPEVWTALLDIYATADESPRWCVKI